GLIGLGITRLREKASAAPDKSRALAYAGLAFLLIAIPAHSAVRINHWYKQGFDYLGGAGKAADAVSTRNDLFLVNCAAASVPLYYLDRRGWGYELDMNPAIADQVVDEDIAQGARFIASEKRGMFAEPDGVMWKRFRAQGAPVWDDGKLVIFPLAR
ncbi:MAG: hypothetical protein PHS14_16140, partial [Elusimicrobia bacterium]|nr:hypothetical protein [Elusimicrobiota bacterium]